MADVWDKRRDALTLLADSYEGRDSEAWSRAEKLLYETARSLSPSDRSYERDDAADRILEALTTKPSKAYPLPFESINKRLLGGLRAGQTMILGGATNTGKSHLVDQILESAFGAGAKARLYLNEMNVAARDARFLQRALGIPEQRTLNGGLSQDEIAKAVNYVDENYPFGVTEIAGEGFPDVAEMIRTGGDDVVAVDLVSRFGFQDEKALRLGAQMLDAAAKAAGSALILVAHLNEKRVREDGTRPPPMITDLRDSASLAHLADVVGFIWREPQEGQVARLGLDGKFYTAKVRAGKTGSTDVVFEPERLRFVEK